MKLWPHQQAGISEVWKLIDEGAERVCCTSPTGGGKTVMMQRIIGDARQRGMKVALYTNRIMLTEQTSRVLSRMNVRHGIRANGFSAALLQDVQVCSLFTEHARSIRSNKRQLHQADLVLVDECHAQKAMVAFRVFDRHRQHGAKIVGFTATPIGLAHMYENLVVAGTNSELRQCGALVPCRTFGPDEPDCSGIHKVRETGEFNQAQLRKRIHLQVLFGSVLEHFQKLNPEHKPTILFAPGVDESKWFVTKLVEHGVSAAHIDGHDIYVDGKQWDSTPELRAEVLQRSRDGDISVVCNRFVLREGLDMPWLEHCIMATPFGSLTSFLQAGGRLLRAHHGVEMVTLQDHGGNWWRHGSLNENRKWDLSLDEMRLSKKRKREMQAKRETEPICCKMCGGVRGRGAACPYCGHVDSRRWRRVIQIDGTLKWMQHCDYIRALSTRTDIRKTWDKLYFMHLNMDKNGKPRTLETVAKHFYRVTDVWPTRKIIPYLPLSRKDAGWTAPLHLFHQAKDVYQ